jgi:hypothetical protein
VEDGVADDGVILVSAEDDSHGGAVIGAAPLVVVEAHIHVHLADVLVGEFAGLEVKEDEALEQVVIENKVDIEILGLGAEALLAGDEGEALAQFQEECLEIINQRTSGGADDGF